MLTRRSEPPLGREQREVFGGKKGLADTHSLQGTQMVKGTQLKSRRKISIGNITKHEGNKGNPGIKEQKRKPSLEKKEKKKVGGDLHVQDDPSENSGRARHL